MVSLHACSSYEKTQLSEALDRVIADLGGWAPYVARGEKVLLKVNLVAARDPSLAATTHPEFVRAVAESLLRYGADVLVGDSPGGLFNEAALRRAYRVTGMEKLVADLSEEFGGHIELSYDTGIREVEFPKGRMLKNLTLTAMSGAADKVISLCKLKTHGLMTYTGAVKNLFGTVPGTYKAEYHMRMPQAADFAAALYDIYDCVHPCLSLMDAVIGMEGNGPTNGKPRKIGCLLGAADGAELDMVAAGLIGIDKSLCATLAVAAERGVAEKPEIIGDAPKNFEVKDYRLPTHVKKTNALERWVPAPFRSFVKKSLSPRVTFNKEKCVGCGECAANCPAHAITLRPQEDGKRRPEVDTKICIHCYCCQELCPRDAVEIKEAGAFKLANKL